MNVAIDLSQLDSDPTSSPELASNDAPASAPALAQPQLSGFVREAIREKASRELSALLATIDAFDHMLAVKTALDAATADLTQLLGGLSAIAADNAAIARAKKLRKAIDEACEGTDGLIDATAAHRRKTEAEEKREELVAELERAGIALEGTW